MEPYEELESLVQIWSGMPHAVVCNSGTCACHLALESLRLPLGSEVVCPDYTMVACARAITLAGHIPVFVDCTPDLLMDLDLLDRALSHRDSCIRAILCTHIYGRTVPMDEVAALACKYGTYVVEDLAEAHGVQPHRHTDVACWSFYKNKIVAGEEGGGMAFAAPTMARQARQLRSLGFGPDHDFRHVPRGINGRLANALASLIIPNLINVVNIVEERRRIEALYDLHCPEEWTMPPRVVPWVYDCRVRGVGRKDQDVLVQALNLYGIAARHGFKRMSSQAEYRDPHRFRCTKSLDSDVVGVDTEVIYFPIQPGVTTEDVVKRGFEIARKVLGY